MSGFGFWGGPEGVEIPMPRIEGQEDRPYFHGGPGWSHHGPAYQCMLPHPGEPGWNPEPAEPYVASATEQAAPAYLAEWELELLEAAERADEESAAGYVPRHRAQTFEEWDEENQIRFPDVGETVYPFGDPSSPAMLVKPEGYELKYIPPKVAPRSVLLWVGVDLDGTIAEPLWTPENPTSEIGAPIWRNLGKLVELTEHGYKIVVHTSRPWTDYEAIETWLNHHQIPWHQIQAGKPLFALYVDDRGRHSEEGSWLP